MRRCFRALNEIKARRRLTKALETSKESKRGGGDVAALGPREEAGTKKWKDKAVEAAAPGPEVMAAPVTAGVGAGDAAPKDAETFRAALPWDGGPSQRQRGGVIPSEAFMSPSDTRKGAQPFGAAGGARADEKTKKTKNKTGARAGEETLPAGKIEPGSISEQARDRTLLDWMARQHGDRHSQFHQLQQLQQLHVLQHLQARLSGFCLLLSSIAGKTGGDLKPVPARLTPGLQGQNVQLTPGLQGQNVHVPDAYPVGQDRNLQMNMLLMQRMFDDELAISVPAQTMTDHTRTVNTNLGSAVIAEKDIACQTFPGGRDGDVVDVNGGSRGNEREQGAPVVTVASSVKVHTDAKIMQGGTETGDVVVPLATTTCARTDVKFTIRSIV